MFPRDLPTALLYLPKLQPLHKCTRLYDPTDEGGLLWNDPDIGIDWNVPESTEVLLSEKDKNNPTFKELKFSF